VADTKHVDRASRHVLSAAKGSGFLAGGNIFELATRFFISLILARALGSTGYGLYNLAVSAGTIFAGIAALGLDDAIVRYVAIQVRQRDQPGLRGTLQIGLGISTAVSIVLGVALYLGAEPIAVGVFHEPDLTELLRLFAVIAPAMTVSNVLAATAKGFKRMDHAALAENVVMSIVRLALLAGLLAIGLDVFAASVVFGISDIAASLTLVLLTNRHFRMASLLQRGAQRHYKEMFSFALPLWLSGMLLQFRKNIVVLLLGAMSAAADVGLISIVGRINLLSHVMYRAIINAVRPVLAELSSVDDRDELRVVYRASTRWTFMLNVPVFLVMVLYPVPLLSIFGESFVAGAAPLVVMAFSELANAGTGTCGSIIDMTGHTRVKLANSIGWMTLLIVSNVLLIPRYGVLGAAVASLLSTTAINGARVIEVWVLERVQPYDRTFLKPIAGGLVAAGSAGALAAAGIAPRNLLEVGVAAVLITLVYGGINWLAGIAPEDRAVVSRALLNARRAIGR
jgi:O-antigen/teichoic acid export membrane protein